MFRRQLLPCACLAIALGVVALVASAVPASSQDATTEERLDRLERDLNMLQRQVYQGAPPPITSPGSGAAGAGSSSGAAVDIEVRMERLEQQMRDLTGRVEEVGNRLEQLRQRIEQINSDVDMRLGQASGAAPPAAAADAGGGPVQPAQPGPPDEAGPPPAGGPPPLLAYPPDQPGDALTPPPPNPNEPPPDNSGAPTPIFGTLTPPGAAPPPPPLPPREAAATVAPPVIAPPAAAAAGAGAPLPAGPPGTQFDYAFGLVRKANYPAAETALKAFVEQHPKDRLAGSAQYWLGETYFQRGRFLEAASAFAEGYKRYPQGPKAADDLLKLGMALARANQKQNACLAFSQLDHDFPRPGTAIKERAVAERRHLGC